MGEKSPQARMRKVATHGKDNSLEPKRRTKPDKVVKKKKRPAKTAWSTAWWLLETKNYEFNKLLAWSALTIYLLLTLTGYVSLPKQEAIIRRVPRRLLSIQPMRTYNFLPKTEWPFTLKNHPEQFETIIHPGDGETEVVVPTFWSPPIHQNKLMSRDLAMHVGSCAERDAFGNIVRGEKCPLDKRTIFVGIASYRDYQCRLTVESIFQRALHPERIRVAVVDQIAEGLDIACDVPLHPCENQPEQALCKYKEQIDVFEVEAELSLGPVFARHLGNRMYRGEYYAMQTDAHITFVKNWDTDIIQQLETTENEMGVLSTYLSDINGSLDDKGFSLRDSRPIMCNTIWSGNHMEHDQQPESKPKIKGSPQLEPWWGAGFSFSRGHFVVNVPYDAWLPMIFQGEEMSITLRGFSVGYDFFTPERSVCFHHYERKHEPAGYFYENEERYKKDLSVSSMKRLLGVVHMNPEVEPELWSHRDENIYGLGNARTPELFYKTFGIDVFEKTAERHMCRWVDNGSENGMHKIFAKHLRADGMGIDYEELNYRFTDPAPGENDDEEESEDEEESDDEDEEEDDEEEEDE